MIYQAWVIGCDRCHKLVTCADTRTWAIAAARAQGWRVDRHAVRCPECQKEEQGAEAE